MSKEVVTVNVLGTEYEIVNLTDKEDELLINRHGYCDCTSKRIVMNKQAIQEVEKHTVDEEYYYNQILRHELVHAYFFESGIDDYNENEQLVDWIAIQLPKMVDVMEEIEIL